MTYNPQKYNPRGHSNYVLNQQYVTDWLIANDKTQKELASLLGVCEQRMSYIINAQDSPLTLRLYPKVVKALEALGVEDTSLCFEELEDA
jgi:hypothetical protein